MNKRFINLWFPVFAWCFVIFVLSAIPSLKTNLGIWDLVLRKIAHIIEYAILFLLINRAINKTYSKLSQITVFSISAILSVLYACSDEFHQAFVPGRGPSLEDVGIDIIGVIVGLMIYIYWKTHRKKSEIRISNIEKM